MHLIPHCLNKKKHYLRKKYVLELITQLIDDKYIRF